MIDKNWTRWIFASVVKHFTDRRQGLTLFVEGQRRDTPQATTLVELRFDGPHYVEMTRDHWHIQVEINVLIQTAMDNASYHTHFANCGIVQVAFTDIMVYRYGNGPDDDDTLLGCLRLLQDLRDRDRVETNQLGQIDKDIPLIHATLEGHYKMLLGGATT